MLQLTAPPPLALYIHMPWCVRKCPYCDFNSHALRGELPEHAYVAALIRDLEQELPRVRGRRVHAVFIGGGTPSLFSPEAIEALLSAVRARLPLEPDAEVTLEANPGTVDHARLRGLRAAGVNRLSLGVQSLDERSLKALGRIHGPAEAVAAATAARDAGFEDVNLDLMFALPDQNPEQALADLQAALALRPTHLSVYQLTLEANTYFALHPPALPDDDTAAVMQERLQRRLAEHGYRQYEVSNYAQPGRQCRHNLNYWRFGDYLGIGAGAHGKISGALGITRTVKPRQPKAYLESAGTPAGVSERRLTRADAAFEFMLNALRLRDGFPPPLFPERTGLPLSAVEPALGEAEARGLIARDPRVIRPTELGQRFLNDLLLLFLPDQRRARVETSPGLAPPGA